MAKTPELAARVRSRHVWDLAWPTIISNLTLTSVGLVHIKIVSSHGTEAIAAVTTGHRVYFLLQAILMGLAAGATAIIARHWGGGARNLAGAATYNALKLALWAALLSGILFFAGADLITTAFGLEQEAARLAAQFVRVMAAFNLLYALSMILTTAIRAAGDARTAMHYSIASALLNIALCVVLANGYFGFPALGAIGAALAGGLSSLLVCAPLTWKWINGKLVIPFERKGDAGDNKKLIKLAGPAALEQAVINLGLIVFMALVANYGTAAFAAYGLGISLLSAVLVIGFSFSLAGATLTAQYLGANNPQQAWQSALRTIKLSFITLVVLGTSIIAFGRALSSFMVDDPDVIDNSVLLLGVLAAVLPLMSIEMAIGGVLRGAGDTRFPLLATFAGLFTRIIVGLVVIYLELPLVWLYGSMIADYFVKMVLMIHRFPRKQWLK